MSYELSGALRELSVALCRGNASLGRSGLYALTQASGQAPLRGRSCSSAETVLCCPRLPVARSPWLTCVGVSRAFLVWVCLMWLAVVCFWPRLFAFQRPCCSACPLSLSVTHRSMSYLLNYAHVEADTFSL
jgi:hypothetical protein